MSEFKFIFTGTPGAGKTTAIQAVSDVPTISTELPTTDELSLIKEETTVAMDFGQISLEDGVKVNLYGTPGQERFRFMWDILIQGGLGLIILVDNSRPTPLQDLDIYLDNFENFINETGAVVGVTRYQDCARPSLDDYQTYLEHRGLNLPVLDADVRKKDDVLLLMDMLFSILESS